MQIPQEPTSAECTAKAPLGDGWVAMWYPQMGGYVGKAAVFVDANGCFEVAVWHDGEFPFSGEGAGVSPVCLHHCDPTQFVRFGEDVAKLVGINRGNGQHLCAKGGAK